MFSKLAPVKRALGRRASLECSSDEAIFEPRQEMYAREGSSEKWLQQIAGYWFARARLQQVRFTEESGVDQAVSFCFYLDETEPLNSDDPRRNVNPEVICCKFDAGS